MNIQVITLLALLYSVRSQQIERLSTKRPTKSTYQCRHLVLERKNNKTITMERESERIENRFILDINEADFRDSTS